MRKLLLVLLLTFSLTAEEKPSTIRVLLTKLADDVQIEVKGKHLLYNPKTEAFLASSHKAKSAKIKAHEKGLYWGEVIPCQELRIVPDEPSTTILVGGIQYKGWIEIYHIGGTINIVNEVDAENFLKATLSPKLSSTLSKETLDAIAITERTNLYYHIEKDAYATWQLKASEVGYYGVAKNKPICDAVERTRDMVLYLQKKPFPATWGYNLAGRSVPYSSIFRKVLATTKGVDNLPSLDTRSKSVWKLSFPIQTLANIAGLKDLQQIKLFRAENSTKVYGMRLTSSKGQKDFPIETLQRALGSTPLPSNDFSVSLRGRRVHFVGYGKGLGTGLCVASSEILSHRQASVEKILLTHFPGARLLNIRQESGKRPPTHPAWL